MNKNLKIGLAAFIVVVALFLLYRLFFIRVVNYEIAGIKIPSAYNALTGSVKPLIDYRGKGITKTVEDRQADKLGLSEEQVIVAQLRWAVFEEWAGSYPEYKGWESNGEIFKKADDDFKKYMKEHGARLKVVR